MNTKAKILEGHAIAKQQAINIAARKRVEVGIDGFFHDYKMFANIVCTWELVEDPTGELTKTFATDGKKLYYHPPFVDTLSIRAVAWIILHQAGHVWLGHHFRMRGTDSMEANICFDLAWNHLIEYCCPPELRDLAIFPGRGKYKDMPKNKEAEYYWTELFGKKQQEQQPQSGDGQEQDSQGDDQNAPSDAPGSEDSASGEESESQQSDGAETSQETSDGDGQAGDDESSQSQQASGGNDGKESSNAQPTIGEVLPCPGSETEEGKATEEGKWQRVVAESIAISQQCGNAPGWMTAIGEKLLGKTEIPWTAELKRFLTKSVPIGQTYLKPSRRLGWRQDIRMPCRHGKGAGKVLIIADVSGSIFSSINESVMPEIEKILMTLPRCEIELMQVNTTVQGRRTFKRDNFPLRLPVEWKGAGGTDLEPGFKEARKRRSEFKAVICVTDFWWGYHWITNPGLPLLWIAVNRPGFKEKVPYGKVVNVKQ